MCVCAGAGVSGLWPHLREKLGGHPGPLSPLRASLQGSNGGCPGPGTGALRRGVAIPRQTYPRGEPCSGLFLLQLLHNVRQRGLPGGGAERPNGTRAFHQGPAWWPRAVAIAQPRCQALCALAAAAPTLAYTAQLLRTWLQKGGRNCSLLSFKQQRATCKRSLSSLWVSCCLSPPTPELPGPWTPPFQPWSSSLPGDKLVSPTGL